MFFKRAWFSDFFNPHPASDAASRVIEVQAMDVGQRHLPRLWSPVFFPKVRRSFPCLRKKTMVFNGARVDGQKRPFRSVESCARRDQTQSDHKRIYCERNAVAAERRKPTVSLMVQDFCHV